VRDGDRIAGGAEQANGGSRWAAGSWSAPPRHSSRIQLPTILEQSSRQWRSEPSVDKLRPESQFGPNRHHRPRRDPQACGWRVQASATHKPAAREPHTHPPPRHEGWSTWTHKPAQHIRHGRCVADNGGRRPRFRSICNGRRRLAVGPRFFGGRPAPPRRARRIRFPNSAAGPHPLVSAPACCECQSAAAWTVSGHRMPSCRRVHDEQQEKQAFITSAHPHQARHQHKTKTNIVASITDAQQSRNHPHLAPLTPSPQPHPRP